MKTTVTAAGILKPIVYSVDMSSERPAAADSAALFAEVRTGTEPDRAGLVDTA